MKRINEGEKIKELRISKIYSTETMALQVVTMHGSSFGFPSTLGVPP